ncbi:MAG TPA: hypothetical protein VH092_06315 [Urbifossiella sp.]|nr:hypothetical protein [Urbifossiella sp.]
MKDKELMTLKEFEEWATQQPWYVPSEPIPSLRETIDLIVRTVHPAG